METVAAVCYLLSGSNVVILRHPESVRLIRSFIEMMFNGGMATNLKGIAKNLEAKAVDLISLSPSPNLDFGGAEAEKGKTCEAGTKGRTNQRETGASQAA